MATIQRQSVRQVAKSSTEDSRKPGAEPDRLHRDDGWVADCDLVIESAVEKEEISANFSRCLRGAKPDAIVAPTPRDSITRLPRPPTGPSALSAFIS